MRAASSLLRGATATRVSARRRIAYSRHRIIDGDSGDDAAARGARVAARVVLCHAAGFNKETLYPVIAELERTLRPPPGACVELLALDTAGHGRSRAMDLPVDHRELARDVLDVVSEAHYHQGCGAGAGAPPLLGVGHSLGGTALAFAEVLAPATFAHLLLFEPIIYPGTGKDLTTGPGQHGRMVRSTLRRRARWPSRAAAKAYCLRKGVWQTWHPDAVDAYVRHGLGPTAGGAADGDDYAGEVRLRCDPAVEADIYKSTSDLWQYLRACPAATAPGARGGGLRTDVFAGGTSVHMSGYAPSSEAFYAVVVGEAHPGFGMRAHVVDGASHFVVMEQPGRVAAEIRGALLPFWQPPPPASKL